MQKIKLPLDSCKIRYALLAEYIYKKRRIAGGSLHGFIGLGHKIVSFGKRRNHSIHQDPSAGQPGYQASIAQ